MTVGDGYAFLVANAEADDEVIDSADPNFSDTASAADKDATASSTATTALQLSSGGMEFTGSANISASDDGGGGDASAFVVREFTLTEDLFYHLDATLGGSVFGDTTAGHDQPQAGLESEPLLQPNHSRLGLVRGVHGGGHYEIEVEVGCSPDFERRNLHRQLVLQAGDRRPDRALALPHLLAEYRDDGGVELSAGALGELFEGRLDTPGGSRRVGRWSWRGRRRTRRRCGWRAGSRSRRSRPDTRCRRSARGSSARSCAAPAAPVPRAACSRRSACAGA